MSLLRPELVGRSWSDWLSPSVDPSLGSGSSSHDGSHSNSSSGPASPSEKAKGAGPSAAAAAEAKAPEITPNSSRSHSPRPLTPCADDVMKLPKKDMHIFGLCPVQDEFVLVVCDHCSASVKMEAFASHVKLRHGARAAQVSLPPAAATTAATASKLAKVERNLRQCTVDLSKDTTPHQEAAGGAPGILRAPVKATAEKELKVPKSVEKRAPLVPPVVPPAAVPPPAVPAAAKPEPVIPKPEPMEVDLAPAAVVAAVQPQPQQQQQPLVFHKPSEVPAAAGPAEEIPDSTTNSNVISIPDTGEPLPHSMSGDIMAMMGEAETADSTTNTSAGSNENNNSMINLKVGGDSIVLAPPVPVASSPQQQQLPQQPPSPPGQPQQLQAQAAAPKPGASVILPTAAAAAGNSGAAVANAPPGGGGKKLSGKGAHGMKPVREYHPDKHCGVWDNEAKRNCTRALTCKSHSVLLKRKIDGRSKPFDELVAAHKKAQAAAAAAAQAAATSGQQPTVVQQQPLAVQRQQVAVTAVQQQQQQATPTVSVVVSATATAPSIPVSAAAVPITAYSNVMTSPTIIHHQTAAAAHHQQGVPVQVRAVNHQAVNPVSAVQSTVRRQPLQLHSHQPQLSSQHQQSLITTTKAADNYADENLHYTTDHPKPLAVCTFGGRRIGGLLIADRSQFLTRKLVRVAITSNGGIHRLTSVNNQQHPAIGQAGAGGLANQLQHQASGGVLGGFHSLTQSGNHRISRPRVGQPEGHIGLIKGGGVIKRTSVAQPTALAARTALQQHQQQPVSTINIDASNYVVNYNPAASAVAAAIKRQPAVTAVTVPVTTVNMVAAAAGQQQQVNLCTLQPGGALHAASVVIPSDSFKTDIQDFKGGIKFERGRKIKHILPTGGEIAQ